MLRYLIFSFLAFALGMNFEGFAHPLDSIGVEKKKGKIYILHKTEAKETFYSISKKYHVTVNVLKAENPEIASGLKVGHIIQVPYTGKIAKGNEPVNNKVEGGSSSATSSNSSSNSSSKTHTVAPKETLYSISKKYHVSVEEIKRANGGKINNLHPGNKIIIPGKNPPAAPIASEGPKKVEKKAEPAPVAISEKQTVKTEEKQVAKTEVRQEEKKREEPKMTARAPKEEQPSYKSDNESSFKKITENGVAELLEDKSGFHVGLHKSAPIGTIIQVKNNENNSKIFLRVIGKLENNNGKTILKMSPKAFERLGARDKKVPVSLSYIL